MAKSLLEQVSLVSQGREVLYGRILTCVQNYVRDDLTKFDDIEPTEMISHRPIDDPLEQILYLTSVGEPSLVYQTVRSLRQARSSRLGALQRKLPQIQIFLLWTLAAIVLFTFYHQIDSFIGFIFVCTAVIETYFWFCVYSFFQIFYVQSNNSSGQLI